MAGNTAKYFVFSTGNDLFATFLHLLISFEEFYVNIKEYF
jgi:hypothetical protein